MSATESPPPRPSRKPASAAPSARATGGHQGLPTTSGWRAEVELRATQIEDGLAVSRAGSSEGPSDTALFDCYARIVEEHIAGARAGAAGQVRWLVLRDWVSGSARETAFREIHAADAALLMLLPQASLEALLPEFRASLSTVLGSNDGRTAVYLAELDKWKDKKGQLDEHRDDLRVMRETVNASADVAHANRRLGYASSATGHELSGCSAPEFGQNSRTGLQNAPLARSGSDTLNSGADLVVVVVVAPPRFESPKLGRGLVWVFSSASSSPRSASSSRSQCIRRIRARSTSTRSDGSSSSSA
jgi:hypothetical protein